MRRSILVRLLSAHFRLLNRVVRWHRLPTWLAVLNLWALRHDLRAYNLHDTSRLDHDAAQDESAQQRWTPRWRSPARLTGPLTMCTSR